MIPISQKNRLQQMSLNYAFRTTVMLIGLLNEQAGSHPGAAEPNGAGDERVPDPPDESDVGGLDGGGELRVVLILF